MGLIMFSNVPGSSHHRAWRSGGRDCRALRRIQGLSRTPEDERTSCSRYFVRHLHYDDGAGTRGPSRGGTCRGRACSVPCTRSDSGTSRTRASPSTLPSTSDVRDRPAGPCAGALHGPVHACARSSDADKADPHLQAQDGPCEERCRSQEDPEAEEALSEKLERRAWVHKPTLRLFWFIDVRAYDRSAHIECRLP
jgi:hypothetical protein